MKTTKANYFLSEIPDGVAGIRATLKAMGKIIKQFRHNPIIREKALELTRGLRQKDFVGEARAIHQFVRDDIRYVKDVRGVETLQFPTHTLDTYGQGDCDDKSMLVASLLEAVGHKTRLIAIGPTPGVYTHVFVQTKIGPRWWNVETTENWPLGKGPGKVPKPMVERY